MTLEEAQAVAAILTEAHEGCPYCVDELCAEAAKTFPEFQWKRVGYANIEVTAR